MRALMELRDIRKIYHGGTESEVRALDGITLTIGAGEFVAIVGQSGSGKSTLMNCMGCLDRPSSGGYLLNGQEVSRMNDRMLSQIRNRMIGFIFQGFNLISDLTALENTALPLLYRGTSLHERTERAQKALEAVGLAQRMDHRPAQLSGGQQQRVAIARVLAAEPSVLLADEPTGNLDTVTGEGIVQLLRTLNEAGHTVVLITHDPRVAAVAPRTICLHDGRISQDSGINSASVSSLYRNKVE